jgi:urea transport system permease protein
MTESPAPVATVPAPPPAEPIVLPAPRPERRWLRRVLLVAFLAALFLPAWEFADDRYWLPLFCRFMSLALFALSVDLVWGYTGLLTLGQGVFFGVGVYAVGYALKLRQAAIDAAPFGTAPSFVAGPNMAMPDFMEWSRLPQVPAWIAPLINLDLALVLAVAVPTVLAALFGAVTFWRRIKGVYFSLITQAVLLAAYTVIDSQLPYTGGRVGMIRLARLELFGHTFHMVALYLLITGVLVVCFVGCTLLMRSKFGKIITAIRDNEYRVMALGYNTAMYKTFLFAIAGGLSGLAGALYVPALGNVGPDSFGIVFSIEVVVMVAVGGRGTLFGAVLGAILVNLGEIFINDWQPALWPIIMGSLFIGVVVFMPDGIVGWLRTLTGQLAKLRTRKATA